MIIKKPKKCPMRDNRQLVRFYHGSRHIPSQCRRRPFPGEQATRESDRARGLADAVLLPWYCLMTRHQRNHLLIERLAVTPFQDSNLYRVEFKQSSLSAPVAPPPYPPCASLPSLNLSTNLASLNSPLTFSWAKKVLYAFTQVSQNPNFPGQP